MLTVYQFIYRPTYSVSKSVIAFIELGGVSNWIQNLHLTRLSHEKSCSIPSQKARTKFAQVFRNALGQNSEQFRWE